MDAGNALRTHRLLLRIAFAAANAFAWIFVFEYFYIVWGDVGQALARVILLYALSQSVTCLLTPFTARGLRHGVRREMIYGVVLAAAAFIFLGSIFEGFFDPYYSFAMVAFAIFLGGYRALYWVPYEVERHEAASHPARIPSEILIALMPAFAGFMMSLEGMHEGWLLYAAGIVIILSLLPLTKLPDVYERFPWSYRETFGQLFARAHRALILGAVIDGIQGTALLIIWPLLIFLIAGWSYPLFGAILSFSFLILIVARDWIASTMREMHIHDSLPVSMAIASSAWIGRILVVNPLSVVIVDSYAHAGNPKISTDHPAFEQTSDGGHYIDEFTALREIGLTLGRIILCAIVAGLIGIFALPLVFGIAFVIASFCAGVSVMLSRSGRASI